MNIIKKRSAIVAAVVLATGVTVAGTTSAFAASSGSSASAASTSAKGVKTKAAKDRAKDERAMFVRGSHGERTVKGKDGAWVTREWQVGKVTAVSGTSVTVVSGDGTSWTWAAGATTKVHDDETKATLSAVQVGDEVLVAGTQTGGVNDATVVADPGQAKIQKWEQAAQKAQAKRAANKTAKSGSAAGTTS